MTELKTEKDRLLVEREKLQQTLAHQDLQSLDARRLALALSGFEHMVGKLDLGQRKELMALCGERIEVRERSGGRPEKGRLLDIRLRLHAAQMVAGMEEHVALRVRETRMAPLTKRVMTIESRVRLSSPAEILNPVKEPLLPSPAVTDHVANPESRILHMHPLHLAIAWKKKLKAHPELKPAALARSEDVSEATVSRTLKLLRLNPEIQAVLLRLKHKEDVRRYSLNKMVAVADYAPDEQQKVFAGLSA